MAMPFSLMLLTLIAAGILPATCLAGPVLFNDAKLGRKQESLPAYSPIPIYGSPSSVSTSATPLFYTTHTSSLASTEGSPITASIGTVQTDTSSPSVPYSLSFTSAPRVGPSLGLTSTPPEIFPTRTTERLSSTITSTLTSFITLTVIIPSETSPQIPPFTWPPPAGTGSSSTEDNPVTASSSSRPSAGTGWFPIYTNSTVRVTSTIHLTSFVTVTAPTTTAPASTILPSSHVPYPYSNYTIPSTFATGRGSLSSYALNTGSPPCATGVLPTGYSSSNGTLGLPVTGTAPSSGFHTVAPPSYGVPYAQPTPYAYGWSGPSTYAAYGGETQGGEGRRWFGGWW